MTLWMIFGPYLGCGKTAFMVERALQAHAKGGQDIMANFGLDCADEVAPGEVLLMEEHPNTLLCIDELWTIIDSRSWGDNSFYNGVVLMSRKTGNDILGTSQMPGMVDLRFRSISDYRVLCTRVGADRDLEAVILSYVGTPDVWQDELVTRWKKWRFRVGDVAGHYNTNQIVEANPRLYVCAVAKMIRPSEIRRHGMTWKNLDGSEWSLYDALVSVKTETARKQLLSTYLHVPPRYQVEVLAELGLTW